MTNSALSQLSGLEVQKMIDSCDREVALIEHDFALLERSDFVELMSSSATRKKEAIEINGRAS